MKDILRMPQMVKLTPPTYYMAQSIKWNKDFPKIKNTDNKMCMC